jgi:DNA-binding MarR family transcriptional regulator
MVTAKSPADVEQALGFVVGDIVRLLRRDFLTRGRSLRLTPALARLLFHVDRAPGSHQSELAARLEVTPVTLGRMIDRLVDCGYLKRVADRVDRRAFRVYIDRAGEPLVGQMNEIRRQTEARATDGFGIRERAALLALLERVRHNLTDEDA